MGTVCKTLHPKVAEIEIEKGRKKDTFPAICYITSLIYIVGMSKLTSAIFECPPSVQFRDSPGTTDSCTGKSISYNFDNLRSTFSRIVPVLRIVSKTSFGALVPHYCFVMNSSSRIFKKESNAAHENVLCGAGTRHHSQQRTIRFIHRTSLRPQGVRWLPGHGTGTGTHATPSNAIDE